MWGNSFLPISFPLVHGSPCVRVGLTVCLQAWNSEEHNWISWNTKIKSIESNSTSRVLKTTEKAHCDTTTIPKDRKKSNTEVSTTCNLIHNSKLKYATMPTSSQTGRCNKCLSLIRFGLPSVPPISEPTSREDVAHGSTTANRNLVSMGVCIMGQHPVACVPHMAPTSSINIDGRSPTAAVNSAGSGSGQGEEWTGMGSVRFAYNVIIHTALMRNADIMEHKCMVQ